MAVPAGKMVRTLVTAVEPAFEEPPRVSVIVLTTPDGLTGVSSTSTKGNVSTLAQGCDETCVSNGSVRQNCDGVSTFTTANARVRNGGGSSEVEEVSARVAFIGRRQNECNRKNVVFATNGLRAIDGRPVPKEMESPPAPPRRVSMTPLRRVSSPARP